MDTKRLFLFSVLLAVFFAASACSNITGEKKQILYELDAEISQIVQYNELANVGDSDAADKIDEIIIRIGKMLKKAKELSPKLNPKDKKAFDEEIAFQIKRLENSIQDPLYQELMKYKNQ
ncbi:MAG: hypothetical protein A2Y33_04705 [Spirochaetes bacterium GWF1_51_8]|nr:MAG: hypothetical protein A2Y33_04705 [Spirochaetes bacterium GWF1_51_8]